MHKIPSAAQHPAKKKSPRNAGARSTSIPLRGYSSCNVFYGLLARYAAPCGCNPLTGLFQLQRMKPCLYYRCGEHWLQSPYGAIPVATGVWITPSGTAEEIELQSPYGAIPVATSLFPQRVIATAKHCCNPLTGLFQLQQWQGRSAYPALSGIVAIPLRGYSSCNPRRRVQKPGLVL